MWKQSKDSQRIAAQSRPLQRARVSLAVAATCTLTVVLTACGSGSSKPVIVNPSEGLASMPTAPAATAANTYTGTDSLGVWTLQLDDNARTYSYSESTATTPSASGTLTATNGFLSLGSANGVSLGYILEVPSRLAILRAGGPGSPLVVSVPQTTCYSIPYLLRFQYIGMDETDQNAGAGGKSYGSIIASSSTDGSTWQYQSLTGTSVDGPASFAGTCATSNGQATLGIASDTLLESVNAAVGPYFGPESVNTFAAIGPSGFWVAYQLATDPSDGALSSFGSVGMAEPSTAISTNLVLIGTYLGFVYESGTNNGTSSFSVPIVSSPASFSQTAGSTTSLTGGIFPNDDVTQSPDTDTIVTLGSQSSTVNGYYPSATITRPDPNANCYTAYPSGVGTSAAGFPICTFPAVAIISDPEGKNAIFLTAHDYTAGNANPAGGNGNGATAAADLQIYLYQQ